MNLLTRHRLPAAQSRRVPGLGPGSRVVELLKRVGVYVILSSLALLTIFPLVWMIMTSFKRQQEVFTSLFPREITFSSYQHVWTTFKFPRHLLSSVLVTTTTVLIIVSIATLAAYAFARIKFRGSGQLFYVFVGSMMIPRAAIVIPLFLFLKRLHLLNTLGGLCFAYLGTSLGFPIFLLRAFFATLPGELGDAAKMDGCSEFGLFSRIYLPLARPGIASVVIFQFMWTWNEFMYATTFVSDANLRTIQPALLQAVGQYGTDWTSLTAGMTLAILPIVIVYILLQRQFIAGLTAGALAGR